MSNLKKRILLFFMVVAVAFGLVGCTNPDNSVRIRFNVEEIEIRQNETKLLEPTIIKSSQVEDVELVFTSSDESVVKIENGVLVPVAMGEATVKVAWAKKDIIFDKVAVKVVKASLPVPTIAYNSAMLKGATQTVSVNLGELNLSGASYSFVALTPEIATISEEGVITAVAVGTAKFEVVVADYEEAEKYELTVQVEESDFAIKYNLNGGTNHAENPVGYSALKLPLPLKEATKVGYEFAGWYEGEELVTEIAAGRLGDVEVEAKWEVVEYAIAYKGLEGATVDAELPDKYTIESAEIVLPVAAKAGYEFLGWYAGEQKVEKIAAGSYGDVEVEAKWETAKYSISYDANGGELNSFNSHEEIVAEFLKDFNAFSGKNITTPAGYWNSSTNRINFFKNEEMHAKWAWIFEYLKPLAKAQGIDTKYIEKLISYPVVESEAVYGYQNLALFFLQTNNDGWNATYKAEFGGLSSKWTAIDCTSVTFEGYQSYLPAYFAQLDLEFTCEEEVALATPAREGYEFLGWYAGEQKVEKIAKGTIGDVKLVAKWEAIQYSVSYDAAGGELKSFNSHEDIVAEFLKDFNAFSGKNITTPAGYWNSGANRINFFKNEEMHAKWAWIFEYLKPLAKAQGIDTKYIEKLISYPVVESEAVYGYQNLALFFLQTNNDEWNATYKAEFGGLSSKWTAINCTSVTFDSYKSYLPEQFPQMDVDFTCEEEVALPTPARKGYEFAGWYAGEQKVEKIAKGTIGDLALVAHWNAIEYTIEYVLDGGVNAEANPAKYTIESETITLAAPSKEGYLFVKWVEGDKVEKGSTGNKTFTAEWEKIVIYTISWDLNGGAWEGAAGVESYEKGSVVVLPTLTRYQHVFLGWYEGEEKVTEIAGKDYVLVAKWENVTVSTDELVIEYELVGGNWQEGKVPDVEHPLAEAMGYIPVKDGYVFAGWHTASDNSVNPPKVTLTAKWEVAVEYTISYNLNGGTNGANPAKYSEYAETIVLAPATKAGYAFAGWFNAEGVEVKEIAKGSKGDLVLEAKWEVAEYEINYDLAGGENAEANPTTYTIESEEIVLAPATKAGYKFLGWVDAEGNAVEKIAAGSYGNVELTATWESLSGSISYDLAGGQWEFAPYTTHEEIRVAFIADFQAYLNSIRAEGTPEIEIPLEEDLSINPETGKVAHINDFFGKTYAYGTQVEAFFSHEAYAAKWSWVLEYIKSTGTDLSSATLLRANIHAFLYTKKHETWPYSYDFSGVAYDSYQSKVPATLGKEFIPVTTYIPGNPIELPVPQKEGFEFAGWLLDGKPFEFTAQTSGELALVASWKAPIVATDLAVADADAKALQAISASGAAVIVYVKAELAEGDYKLVNANLSANLVVKGFATIAKALEYAKAESAQGVVYLAAGTYAENVNINVNDVTLAGANYGVAGNGARAEESAISGKITVAANNIVIDGIKVTGGAESDDVAPISLDACENVKIQNCLLDALYGGLNASYNMNRRAMIAKISGTTAKDVVVTNNKIDFGGHSGTYLKVAIAGYGFNTLHFVNNEVTASHTGEYARVYDGLGSNIYVYGNTVPADAKFIVASGTLVETAQ